MQVVCGKSRKAGDKEEEESRIKEVFGLWLGWQGRSWIGRISGFGDGRTLKME